MDKRRIDGFFYGLFMDGDVLKGQSVTALNPRKAYVDDFELCIGRRSTLVPNEGARSYGVVYALTHEDLDRLYSSPGLREYYPEAVIATTLESQSLPALCYNLREKPGRHEANPEYAEKLRAVLATFSFPSDYIESIS
jgi:hypothetical protein